VTTAAAASARSGPLSEALRARLGRQVEHWRDELVDLSKRNRLLYFRPTRVSTLAIREPGLRDVYARILVPASSWGFFLPPDPSQPAPDPPRRRAWDEVVTDKVDPAALQRGLRGLERRSTQTFMDTGLWVLHLGFGMLRWQIPGDPDDAHSPLLLMPITLERESPREPFRMRRTEGDLVLNPALAVKLQTEFGVTLPHLDDPDEPSMDLLFDAVRAACQQWPEWAIEDRVVLATFSFQKEAMYRDLLENVETVLEHGTVQMLGLGADAPVSNGFTPIAETELDEAAPPERLVSILDADASQRQCIKAAIDGHSFVMDGPPGTGKSQTIANIVTELISHGQTVLFVSEKAAALDVVHTRLTAGGLGEYLLPLHSHKATRKEVALELGRALMTQPVPGPRPEESDLDQLRRRRRELTAYVEAINEVRQPLGRTLQWAYGRIAQLHALPRVKWWAGSAADLNIERFNQVLDCAAALARAWGPIARGDDFLWRDLNFERADMQTRHAIKGELEQCWLALNALGREAAGLATALGLDWGNRPERAPALVQVARHLQGRPDVPAHWLCEPRADMIRARIDELERAWGSVLDAGRELANGVGPNWWEMDVNGYAHLTRARAACPWHLPDSSTTSDVAGAERLADQLSEQLPWIAEQAARLYRAFAAVGGEMTISAMKSMAELGRMVANRHKPEAEWLNPLQLPSLTEAVQVLQSLVSQCRGRQKALAEVFNESVLALDLETLAPRFERLYAGPFRFFRRGYRADKELLAPATRLGRVDGRVRTRLGEALEWQHVSRELQQAERQHAAVIGEHYYQGERTDFVALTAAVESAQKVVELAGHGVKPPALARLLAQGTAPDAEIHSTATDVSNRIDQLSAQALVLIPDSVSALMNAPIEVATHLAEQARPPLGAIQSVLTAVDRVAGRDMTIAEAAWCLERRAAVEQAESSLEAAWGKDRQLLGSGYRASESDWGSMRRAVDWAEDLRALTGAVSTTTAAGLIEAHVEPNQIVELLSRWEQAASVLLARFQPGWWQVISRRLASSYDRGLELLERLGESLGDIDEWFDHLRHREELRRWGLEETTADCATLRVSSDQLVQLVERALLEGWADQIAQGDLRLSETRSPDRDRLVEEFRRLDVDLIKKSASSVIERCNELRPQTALGQAGIIQAEANKRRRHRSIRWLLTNAGEVAQRLKPCFMMSPLSVSQYLPPDFRFDVVVFDEASQVRPCDAINGIYRGDRLIVAGDQKQLPPSSFFEVTVMDGETDDEDELQVFDSVLDLCKGASFQSLSLRWHYRSQHEALIAFSNRNFYDDSLLTFPGAVVQAPDLGLALYRVEGLYRGRGHNDNPIEARKVAERVIHYADLNTRLSQRLSVGVVTFSDAQEEAVLSAIEDVREHRPDLDYFFGVDRLHGFFVKNLESVQGDERDVMIFSVGYARDADGTFALRMGPLTTDGGERRLNVAITRARRRVEVVTSVGPEDFRGEMKPGGGVWQLREYLRYVELGGRLAPAPRETDFSFGSPLEESVAQTLESWGYEPIPQVGTARYRVDIGVRRKGDNSRFILGVECDGAMYHSSRVARDRDRLRQQVLMGLGWKLHRVWSPAWYRNRAAEEEQLRQALREAESEPAPIPVREGEPEARSAPEVREVDLRVDGPPGWTSAYQVATPRPPARLMEMHLPEAGQELQRMVLEVVEVEGPIAIELALIRVRQAWRVGRAGARIDHNFRAQIQRMQRAGKIRLAGEFIWPADRGPELVRVPRAGRPETERKVSHVPPQELDLALAHLAAEATASAEDELTEAVARLFGWRRRGPDIGPALAQSVERLVVAGKLERRGDSLRWLGEPPIHHGQRRVTERTVEPSVEPVQVRRPPTPAPAAPAQPPPPTSRPPEPAPAPTRPRLSIPPNIERYLTFEGHQERLKELQSLKAQFDLARHSDDPIHVARLQSQIDALERRLSEVRMLPPPSDTSRVLLGSVVTFRENGGPEESYQVVPPMEADSEKGRMSVLTPLGQTLFGHAKGDVVEVDAPGGTYTVEITDIALP
jgi:transcription elongation GreA/GreB family factor